MWAWRTCSTDCLPASVSASERRGPSGRPADLAPALPTWNRDDPHQPFNLLADDGTPILLQPGRTFIELPMPGHTLVIPEGSAG